MALNHVGISFKDELKINRPRAAGGKPRLLQLTSIQIQKSMTAAPFLKHAALTPAQREYLYTIAASYSTAHVRSLISQHYMNVLHRSIQAGYNTDRGNPLMTSVTSAENESKKRQSKTHSEKMSRSKHMGKTNTNAGRSGKVFLPNIPLRKARPFDTLASKHKSKKQATSQPVERKSPGRDMIRQLDKKEGEEEEEGLDNYLSECLSSLSMGDWDDDNFSNL
ncbi:protein FAM216A [Leuresthes tenuis]|uniref:protein FAM216A n=1 Tax=Leuresthes tenuis TaxID=355514 RepID=UPI003B51295A